MHFSRIAIIYNPKSGRRRERQAPVNRLAALLRQAGRTVESFATERPQHATELARAALARNFDLVLAHGGDGTMNEVLQAVANTEVAMGFWPGGTANVLAREIGFPRRVADVAKRVLAGEVVQVTVGRANERYFLLMAGIGLDAAVVDGVSPVLKRRLGKGAFALSALRLIKNWSLAPMRVEADGEVLTGRFVVAGNGRMYGGGLRLTPLASLSAPSLDLCIFSSNSRMDYLSYAAAALFGAHRWLPGVTYRQVRCASICAVSEQPVPFQLDGELAGGLPLRLEAIPRGLRLLL